MGVSTKTPLTATNLLNLLKAMAAYPDMSLVPSGGGPIHPYSAA
jgi:hypothetical protein